MIQLLDDITEKIAYKIAQILVAAKVTPMMATLFRFIAAAPTSLYFFSRGEYLYNVIGLFIYMALAFLDVADGHMAQMYKLPKETAPFGRLHDHISDRVLMLIIFGAIQYAGMKGPDGYIWQIITIMFYSAFFFITTLTYEFERTFSLNIHSYPQLLPKMHQIHRSISVSDTVLYNILYVHNNSFTRIFFNHTFLLLFGVLANQLLAVFIYFALMHIVRSAGLFIITYQTLSMKPTNSALAQVLRKYIKP